ncbi:c-type cytochrome [Thermodesulfobacteriota bacterium]
MGWMNREEARFGNLIVILYGVLVAALLVGGLSDRPPATAAESKATADGAALFKKYCAGCHFANKADKKEGPGLKGLFKMKKLPVSGRPVNEANIRKQLETPYDEMPAFLDFTDKDKKNLLEYLKTL